MNASFGERQPVTSKSATCQTRLSLHALAVSVIIVGGGLVSSCAENPRGAVERAVIEGVEVVHNLEGPMFPGEGRFRRVLEIGTLGLVSDSPNYTIGEIIDASLGPAVIAVADRAHRHVKLFDDQLCGVWVCRRIETGGW
jgi:hypothetical protein